MKQYGLIGYPLGHSFSQAYFTEKFEVENLPDCQYTNFPIDDIDMLGSVLSENPDLIGLNVTIPYKEDVLDFCNELSEEASQIRAVNTLKIGQDGLISGHNTDIPGFRNSLINLIGRTRDLRALILGSGGSSKAVRFALKQLGIPYNLVSRQAGEDRLSYDQLDDTIIRDHLLIINTTPLGMSPNTELCPDLPYEHISKNHYLFDLIYNPATTLFLRKGKDQGAMTKNGQEMLILQAEASWAIWNKS